MSVFTKIVTGVFGKKSDRDMKMLTPYIDKINSKVKVGGSNLLNSYHTTSFGSANVGALYYISLLLDDIL